ncbi:hypothetical protein CH72_2929 [Burkholderia ambifaria AMMD]|uniref:Uncharacterized protein n=1 Tax=Burkholderia ambifaria (strain ATCC BAA-244 / DSM 16087 / CCUG 44356 / LMG 19182 / AMMD) TaxID=339670 RepID=Q0BEI1_BURCM|nr:hypothetical protein [Burkholderia ambifaria]ABI87442.1 hypothetical protein Bamb_1886 [Burkholderia ambifaria AMMD]AJY21912.1 hypothetical protein CH72_2929 [Burkholderia ambifaria AMMD]MBR7928934.1 hypothetical protein [Burkholderia ambifaria]QQC05345.1 hypothetical protein I6H84_05430 [Burkholderia ambifaria]UZU03874.1 hypothetical protein OR987_26795 [Burkholderia ambifaria]
MRIVHLVAVTFSLINCAVFAAPLLSKGTSIAGAIAYQDDGDPAQFWYLPLSTTDTLGDRLKSFEVKYFGIGKPFLVKQADGSIKSKAGSIVSGVFSIDLSQSQREKLTKQISKDFGLVAPKLLPLRLTDSKIESILLNNIDGFGDPVEQKWASTFSIGSDSAFSVGSLNSGFAQIVANLSIGGSPTDIPANPAIGVNITGKSEFVGDPWTAIVDCDLSQVWSQVRTSVGASASFGWFRIGGASYNRIAQDLQKSGACTFNMKEGTLDNEKYGRQVMEMTKSLFEEINKYAISGDKYFKFEPNPEAPAVAGGGGGGLSLFGFSVSVNGGYSSASFSQGIRWNTTVSYTGRTLITVNLGTALAVSCNAATQKYFVDLTDAAQPCITQQKIDAFLQRTKNEAKEKASAYKALNDKLLNGSITMEQYATLRAAINDLVYVDDMYALSDARIPNLPTKPVFAARAVRGPIYGVAKTSSGVRVLNSDELLNFKLINPEKTFERATQTVVQ